MIAEQSTGFPGYDSIIGPDNATIGDDPQGERLRHLVVRQEPQHPELPVQLGRAVRPVAVRHGLRLFLRLHGRRDRPVDAVAVPQHTQIFPWIGKPGYNLITDMADEAINYLQRAERGRARQAVLPLLRARRHPRAAPADPGVDRQVQGQVRHGLERHARPDLRQPEAARRDPGEHPADALAGRPAEVGHADADEKKTVRAPGRGVRRLRRLHRPRDRPGDPGGRGHGQARQHADHLHRGRQRHQRRGLDRSARLRPGRDPGHQHAGRRTS